MKIENIRRPIGLFLLACALFPIVYAIISVPWVMIASITGLLGTDHAAQFSIYLLYFLLMGHLFYGGSKKQNRYIFSLEKGKTYTLWEDFRLFLASEGIAVMGAYAVYSVFCFCLKAWIPDTDILVLNLLKLAYNLPIAPSSMMKAPVFLEYLVSLLSFCVIYTFVMMWRRARIRKKWC
jgi:hypothetical protein